MKIVTIPIAEIIPYEKNAKEHPKKQIEQIKASIKEFGFNDPIAVDEKNVIIEGHGRLIALQELGYKEVECIKLEHLTESQKKAYIIAHNKLTLNTGFNIKLLEIELKDIELGGIDLLLTGFTDKELNKFLDNKEDIEDDEYDPTPPEVAKSRLGDLWSLGKHKLLCGDSTVIDDVKRLVGEQSMDMIFTDPPWNVNYGAVKEGNEQGNKPRTIMNDYMSTEAFKDFMVSAFRCMNDVSKDGAMVYVVMSAQEWANVMSSLFETDFHWSSTIIWNKDRLVLSRKDYHTKYEPIWYGWKNGEARLCPLEDRKQNDVWDVDRPSKSDLHPTMKPLELVGRAIKNSSHRNDNVLDLFGGSGSTLITAEQLDRQCYMMELDPKYIDVIVNRYVQFKNNDEDVTVLRNGETLRYKQVFGGE